METTHVHRWVSGKRRRGAYTQWNMTQSNKDEIQPFATTWKDPE